MQWYVFALFAAALLAATDITRKKILFKEPSRDFLVVFTICSAGFALLLFPFVTKLPWRLYLIPLGIGALASIAYHYKFKTIKHFPLSTFLPLTNIQPLIVLVLGVAFLKETISVLQLVGIGLILLGGYALELNSHLNLLHPLQALKKSKYQRYMLAAILLVALLMFVEKISLTIFQEQGITNPHFTLAFFVWPAIAVFTTLSYMHKHSLKRAFQKTYRKEGLFMMIPSLTIVLFMVSFYKALSLYYISLVIPLVRLNTLFSTVLGGGLFHEKHLMAKTLACMIMIIGTFFIVQ